MSDRNLLTQLATLGVHAPSSSVFIPEGAEGQAWRANLQLAMDAQPQLVTQVNAGIPAFLTNILDPEVIDVVMAPLLATTISGGDVQKGSRTDRTIQMPMAEMAGEIVGYGDHDNGGNVTANVDWTSRQSWHWQTVKTIGELQLEQWGLAAIDWNARLDRGAVDLFRRNENRFYFYGVAGLQNYGMLNDPSLLTPISPSTKTAGGTSWITATADEIYDDFLLLFTQLQAQMGGNLQMTDRFIAAFSSIRMVQLGKLNAFGLSVRAMLADNFPNMEFRNAPEYTTASGELLQLIVPEFGGVQSIWTAFTEKFRAHPVVQDLSAWRQKFSAGTWGAIVRRPICVAQMLGI